MGDKTGTAIDKPITSVNSNDTCTSGANKNEVGTSLSESNEDQDSTGVNNASKNNDENIKYRLRNNSGKLTPRKLCKDSISSANVNHLKKTYQAESVSLKGYLKKPHETQSTPGLTNVDTAAHTTSISQGGVNALGGEECNDQQIQREISTADSTSIIASSKEYTTHTEKMSKEADAKKQPERDEEKTMILEEIQGLTNKLDKLEEGSMEKMFIEMRIDMKKDSLKMIERIDKRLEKVAALPENFEKLQKDQTDMANGIQSIVTVQTTEKERLDGVSTKVDYLRDQIGILHGMVQKNDQRLQIQRLQSEQTHLHNVKNNLIISGLDEAEEGTEAAATTAELVTDFFSQTMKISTKISINSAKRIGKANPRAVLVSLRKDTDKSVIFKNGKELREVRNSKDEEIYVNSQLPPFLQEKKKWYRYLMKINSNLTGTNKRTLTIKRGELMIDGKQFYPAVRTPNTSEVMYPLDPKHVDRIKLQRGEEIKREGCTFIAYSTEVKNLADVRAAYTKVMRLNSRALHVACAYRLPGTDYIHQRGGH